MLQFILTIYHSYQSKFFLYPALEFKYPARKSLYTHEHLAILSLLFKIKVGEGLYWISYGLQLKNIMKYIKNFY
jgi:hypothetical protein